MQGGEGRQQPGFQVSHPPPLASGMLLMPLVAWEKLEPPSGTSVPACICCWDGRRPSPATA
jgi:hypothetical protein